MFGGLPTLIFTLGPIMMFFLKYVVFAARPKELKGSPNKPQISKNALLCTAQSLHDIPSQANIVAFLNLNVPSTGADLDTVEAFLRAAAAMKEVPEYKIRMLKRNKRKHCVRCHEEYSDATNVVNACKIPHAFLEDMTFFGKMASFDERIYTHEALCCEGVELDAINGDDFVNLKELGFCFEGKHTTQEITVECRGGTGYNELNVLECVLDPDTGHCILPGVSKNPILLST
ncbi:hypothetical protein BDZ94DRAFT_1273602 [Collybia nuda]|uniref:Uncharacterized protein n=1 Tax=Collybia nuda TaxID=64659 RepID=A0A9P6CDR0_9AGAR|nr:hypothetical protein BDZ94DRAFT_1273602 [Collybia nuda]